jgi:hypothetical protein
MEIDVNGFKSENLLWSGSQLPFVAVISEGLGVLKQTIEGKYDGFFRYDYDGYGRRITASAG